MLERSIAIGFWCAIIGTVCSVFGRWGWPFELATHFRVQYLAVLAASLVVFVSQRHSSEAVVAGMCVLVNVWPIRPLYGHTNTRTPASGSGRRLRLMCANVQVSNQSATSYEAMRAFIRAEQPDLIVAIEMTPPWYDLVTSLNDWRPVAVVTPWSGLFAIGIFSRLPLDHVETLSSADRSFPAAMAQVRVAGRRVTLIGAHPRAPVTPRRLRLRDHQFHQLAEAVKAQPDLVIMVGDLNITSWSPAFGDLVRETGLCDSREGFGIQPSWPVWGPPFRIPIDHCLVSSGIAVHNRRLGPSVGSDHFPVLIDLSIEPVTTMPASGVRLTIS